MSTNLSVPKSRLPALLAMGATLAGFGLRLVLLNRFPLREDEAIYAYWALHAWFEDPRFLTVWPDKPPLFLWTLAGALRAFGVEPAAARLLNVGLSTLTIPVVTAMAATLWGRRAAVIGAVAMALNPFAIAFAPTVFTDPMLVLSGSLALLLALRGRPLWAGFWLGAAIMTKQQGVFYIPLIVGVVWLAESRVDWRKQGRGLLGLLLVVGPILYWDAQRWTVAPSPWDLGARNYGALALLPPTEWPDRIRAWLPWLWELTASWAVWLALPLLYALGRRRVPDKSAASNPTLAPPGHAPVRTYAAALPAPGATHPAGRLGIPAWIGVWSLAFIVLHVVSSMPAWDRYLLPLAPMVALLVARLGDNALAERPRRRQGALALALLVLLIPPAGQAAQGQRPVGGDHGDYAGLHEALAWLDGELQAGNAEKAVLYHRTLGWHYQFYLYDALKAGRYELRWFGSPVYLADNAAKTPARPLFYIQPDWAPDRDLAQHLAMREVDRAPRFHSGRMTVYELRPAVRPYCPWCISTPATIDN